MTVLAMQLKIHFVLEGVSHRPYQLDLNLRKRLSSGALMDIWSICRHPSASPP